MKLKNSFFYTLRENVKDEDSKSSNLLVRAGMIKKSSAGAYMILPLGYKVLNNITQIIREEMNATDCQELIMPALLPEDVYVASGRREGFGKSMFSLKDRFNKPFVLGPTHEELFAIAAQMKIRSYKDLPFSLYQIQTKYRDEPRPRFGLIRVREFIMKDAYTFDVDEAGLDIAYAKQFNAYKNIFDRLCLDYKIVRADTGVMGGLLSEEFQAVTDIGEDILVLCDQCDFASNIEVAQCISEELPTTLEAMKLELVETPNAKTIEEVVNFLQQPAEKFVKTLIYKVDDKVVACMVRGNREVNETKLRKLYNALEVELADPETVVRVTNAQVGFAGPIDIQCELVMDDEVSKMHNFITGANKTGYHYIGVNHSDFKPTHVADIRNIQEGDTCPKCGGKIHFKHGIEVGNTFKLGTKYSNALGLEYLNSENQLKPVWMGSYGIGPARCMAAIAEQYADEDGLKWPIAVAPYQVAVVLISIKDEVQTELANKIYNMVQSNKIDCLLDDRDERPGVKFKDMDLIGVPFRVTVGKKASEGIVEFKQRGLSEVEEVHLDDLMNKLTELCKR
ncbi:proline--tRNA ligase [Anaerorhabdus furcosa]|uniref:Proline--tRNA ligase n=1 Tax=Anaerorhabdus furcosa TaxID=118967 RepID=A0A1T4PHD6_9FIRM|nr:proline--tRNA ligase [Anaerorhabdus furcosa]SJZ90944.1 prolyl-tRNA synthetase [Anaerorhabdus furcosa]